MEQTSKNLKSEQLRKSKIYCTLLYICANFRKTKTGPVFDPYKIIEIGGKKIAFIAVLTPLTYSKTFLCTIKEEDGTPTYDFLGDNLPTVIQTYIDEVRGKGVDHVILLTHMGMDVEEYTSNDLLKNLKGVDAVLDGHTHKVYNTKTKDFEIKDIPISQTGTKLESIGKHILKTDDTIDNENITEVPEPSDTTNAIQVTRSNMNIWVDKSMNSFLNDIWDEYRHQLNHIVEKINIIKLIII